MARRGDFVRLQAAGIGLGRTQNLWLGPRHLLVVDNTGYRENYYRIELTDIQAFVVERTLALTIRSIIFGALLLITASAAYATSGGARMAWALVSVVPALLLLVDLLLGPTCRVFLRTPIQILRLYSLNRVRRARRIMALLRPRIEQAQGTMEPAQLAARLHEVPPLPEPPRQQTGFIR